MYRVCKIFEIEGGHFLSKHKSRCKNPHGHTRKIEVVLAAETLDENDMVCDFKALKAAIYDYIDSFDHTMLVNTDSAHYEYLSQNFERVIPFDAIDPTTEAMAKMIFDHVSDELKKGISYTADDGVNYSIRDCVILERVRVGEGLSSWAEYSI